MIWIGFLIALLIVLSFIAGFGIASMAIIDLHRVRHPDCPFHKD